MIHPVRMMKHHYLLMLSQQYNQWELCEKQEKNKRKTREKQKVFMNKFITCSCKIHSNKNYLMGCQKQTSSKKKRKEEERKKKRIP